jgi:hypothetical protein
MKYILIIIFIFSFTAASMPVKRDIIALYDSTENPDVEDYTQGYIHLKLESVLNHFGYKLTYYDVAKNIPKKLYSKKYMDKFVAVITWFSDSKISNPNSLIDWISSQISNGKKYIVLGELGYLFDQNDKSTSVKKVNNLLKQIGIKYYPNSYDNPLLFEIAHMKDQKLVEFERGLEGELLAVQYIESIDEKNDVWLKIAINDKKKLESDVVIVSGKGAYAQTNFAMFTNPVNYKTQWRINPFEFIKSALNHKTKPIPDVSTINGKRVFYSHIDGDGFINVSYIDRKSYCGEIIRDKVLKKYDLPVTVSIVVAEIDPKILGNEKVLSVAKDIMALNNVEIASHTHSHPLSWNLKPTKAEVKIYIDEPKIYKGGQIVAYKIKDYKLNYWQEVVGSIDWINKNLAPEGKKNEILLWSGSCKPPEIALKHLDETNMINMNGGDGRFDDVFNSYSYLSALYRSVGKYTQVYTSNANENIYTNLWSGPYGGFREVVETFKRTKEPFLMRPINIYYHFYSGEFISSLKALDIANEYTLSQDITPTFASDYVRLVHGFISSNIEKMNENSYLIKDYDQMRSFRFDQDKRIPDYKLSQNVIGHRHYQGNLYVFLQKAQSAKIVLRNTPQNESYISSCNCILDSVKFEKEEVNVKGVSRVDLKLTLEGMQKNKNFKVKWDDETINLNSNDNGQLEVFIQKRGEFKLNISNGII